MTATILTLAEFLLARIAEDESEAHFWDGTNSAVEARVLAECEAKRRILDVWIAQWSIADEFGPSRPLGGQGGEVYYDVLTHLAAVYADHPDYREEWKP